MRPRSPWIVLLLAGSLACCGVPRIAVELVIAPGETPFANVRTVRLSASGPSMETVSASVAYEPGAEVELPRLPPGEGRVIAVEGIDGEGAVLARGESAPFTVTSDGPERVTVPFAACGTQLYRDGDGDGHGDAGRAKRACPAAGWVIKGDDCNDASAEVHPGQTSYFDQPQSPPGSAKPFDYDCDGVESPKLPAQQAACVKSPPGCAGAGWQGAVPPCGESGVFVECGKYPDCVAGTGTSAEQTCR
jgi:hypothetical protein